MGSLVAAIGEDGTLQTKTTSGDSLSTSSKSSNSTVDSDTFLTLLVAEMQNQDPLEPTSNTEWVAQYAQFTQVETMNEMSESMDLLRANSLVGKDVIMKVTSSSTGDVTYASGTVDYVEVENGKPILVIDGNQYSLSDLDTVISDNYSEAYDLYTAFKANISSLPDVKYADTSYADMITTLYNQYNNEMTDYQKNFMTTYASDELTTLTSWVSALKKLGIDFGTTTTETKTTSLDDILESFNTQMNAIMDRLDILSETVAAQGSSDSSSSSSGGSSSSSDTSTASSSDTDSTTGATDVVGDGTSSDDTVSDDTPIDDEQLEQLVTDTETGTDTDTTVDEPTEEIVAESAATVDTSEETASSEPSETVSESVAATQDKEDV
jgi:flagellar basal-body rod modification protein FlgD